MALDTATVVLALHTLVGFLFIGLGLQNFANGRPLGLAVQGLLGVLVIGAGIAAARLVASRD